ncbi:unnamed protein product [Closterium sp. NIES-54]
MRSRQKEGVAGVRSGVERRVHERSVPPSSVGGHAGRPVASPPSRARQTVGNSVKDKEVIVLDQTPLQKTFKVAPKPPPDAFAPLRDMLQGLGKKGGNRVVAGEKSGAPIESDASARKGAVEKRGAPTPSGNAAGKGVGEKQGAPSQVDVAAGLLSKTKADSVAQLGIVGHPVEPVGKRPSSVLRVVCLSKPEATESSDVEKASTVVAARHEKSKKPKVIGYAPPPPPDDQGKTRGCKAPFKGPGMMSRKGKPASEQTVGLRKRFLACRKLSREDIKKDALADANAALSAPKMATRASAAAMAALLYVLLHVSKTFPANQWPDLLYSSAVEGLGSTDAILLQMVRVAAQVCTQWCCCRFAAHLLEDAGYESLAMPEEKSKAKLGDEDAIEAETDGQGE